MCHLKIVVRGHFQKSSPGSWPWDSIEAGGIGASVLQLDLDLDESSSAKLSLSSLRVGYGTLSVKSLS